MYTIPAFADERIKQFQFSPALQERRYGLEQTIDVYRGPGALKVMGIQPDIIFCNEAWPHTDPTWEGRLFFTLTLDGDMYSFGCVSSPDEVSAAVGKTLTIDPMVLHWLRPDPVVSTGWLALQWDVAREDADAFALELSKSVEAWSKPEFELPILGN